MSITRHHNEWLALVPNSGPFVSLLVATQVFPQGLDVHDAGHARRLRQAFEEWDEDQSAKRPDPILHRAWIHFVLRETLGYDQVLAEGQAIPQTLQSELPEHGETLRPDLVLIDPETNRAPLLIQAWPRSQALDKQVAASRWKASPDTRMTQLLRDTGVRLGLVTNGDHWMLVNAPQNETTGYASWYGNLWIEEPITLRAFRTLLCAQRFFGVVEKETIEALLERSASDQQEVTDQLGYQVRKAVEVLIQALDKADQDHGRKLLTGVDERVLYEAALTVMMRLVFLFCAEERGLLLLGEDLWAGNYAVSTLREQLRVTADQHGEEILGFRHDAWARLLTTFRAVYGGVKHDRLKLPAYGGSLFAPDRFPFLEGRKMGTSWRNTEATPLPVSNRTVLHFLEALQVLQVRLPGGGAAEARKLSFRSLDIEQIGHVYEGLLDHTAKRATEPMLGLKGTRDKEPEIALSELEGIAAKGEDALVARLKDETGRSESALQKAFHSEIDAELVSRFRTACQFPDLWERTTPYAALVREDSAGYPVVITPGSVFVTKGTDRRSTGTHYTPRSLTEPIVQYTLEPLVYVGPAEGLPKEQWRLRPAKELLDLKICDMACGSGAFLVQASRYMAARLLEAWDEVHGVNPGTVRVTPQGEVSTGHPGETLIPDDPDERQAYALRIVAQRCLYGVDKNPLAVEMAKLSLWLLTLAKDKPFEFLDHAIRCGDSLVGIHNLDQLRRFNLHGRGETSPLFLGFMDEKVKEAINLRCRLTAMQADTVDDVQTQDRLLREANEQIGFLSCAADLLIAAEVSSGSASATELAAQGAALKVAAHFESRDLSAFQRETAKVLNGQPIFHWPLVFPEVVSERSGFDAFLGNPPFMGGRLIGRALGQAYYRALDRIRANVLGSPDLCAYFLLRAFSLLRPGGTFGLLATKTISETGTRAVCLDQILESGGSVFRALSRARWPGKAAVVVAQVHVRNGPWQGEYLLDGIAVDSINGALEESFTQATPHKLVTMKGRYGQGQCLMDNGGFQLTSGERDELILSDENSREIVQPLYNGKDLNNLHKFIPYRWVINFRQMGEGEAQRYGAAFRRVTERVKPYRDGLTGQIHETRFWLFWDYRRKLVDELAKHSMALASSRHTKYVSFRRVPTGAVYTEATKLFLFFEAWEFAVLQSSLHQEWAAWRSGTLGEITFAYSTTESLETWPMPSANRDAIRGCDDLGRSFDAYRERVMAERTLGLTEFYNCLHDPNEQRADFLVGRELQMKMDIAVAAAYTWSDVNLGHGFYQTKQGVRFTISESARREVLSRLLKLNHERYEEEVRQGLHDKKKPKGGRLGKTAAPGQHGPGLFE